MVDLSIVLCKRLPGRVSPKSIGFWMSFPTWLSSHRPAEKIFSSRIENSCLSSIFWIALLASCGEEEIKEHIPHLVNGNRQSSNNPNYRFYSYITYRSIRPNCTKLPNKVPQQPGLKFEVFQFLLNGQLLLLQQICVQRRNQHPFGFQQK